MKPVYLLCLITILIQSCKVPSSKKRMSTASGKETVLKLMPGSDNPRNSEGDFIELKDGSILFVYSHYTGNSSSDHASAYLAGRRSYDNGVSWTKEDEVVLAKEGLMNVMSVSLLRLKNGDIAMFYLKKNSTSDCIPMMRVSKDEAKTWTEPIACITDKKGYFVLNNDRVIQLKNGRLLMAVALHQVPGEKWSNNGTLFSYFSDDNGISWKSSSALGNPDNITLQEPGVVELKSGDILMIIRASAGVQYKSISKDRGETWTPAEKTSIKSPLSPATIQRIPSTGDLLMVWNNNGGEDPVLKGKRTPLTIAVSKDEGNTWKFVKNLEDDKDGWYCYIAMHFTGKNVLLGYCAGSQSKKTHLSVTDISRLSLNWIYKK